MATARQAQLFEQRRKFAPYRKFQGLRSLAPRDTTVSMIARRTLTAEIERMGDRYINGEIGNEEMFKFLEQQKDNPTLTPMERVNIEDQIKDYRVLIRRDQLEAVYKAAPDNSSQKIIAAEALSRFYQERASGMVSGTPAHSQALSDAASWQARADQEREQIAKQRRTLTRLQAEAQIAKLPTGSSKKEFAKAQAYADLYNTALAEGETVEANRYLVQAQQSQTRANEYLQKETTIEKKTAIRTYEQQKLAEIEKMPGDSPTELTAKYQLYMELANSYAEIGDTARSFQYQTAAYKLEERYDKMMTSESSKAVKKEINYIKQEIKTLDNHYTYNIPYKGENLTAQTYLAAKAALLDTAISYTNEAIDMGISGLDNSLSSLEKDYLDVSDKLEKMGLVRTDDGWQAISQSTLVETIGKNGKKELVDITDPDVAAKYARGEQFYYPIETPRSTEPGKSAFNYSELLDMVEKGQAHFKIVDGNFVNSKGEPIDYDKKKKKWGKILYDENGEPTGKLDLKGKVEPVILPEQYVDIRTPDNKIERVWTKHDDMTGEFLGWRPEAIAPEKIEEIIKQPLPEGGRVKIPVVPQSVLPQASFEKYREEQKKIATYQPKEGEELYYGVNDQGLPFSEVRVIQPQRPVAIAPTQEVRRLPTGELEYKPITPAPQPEIPKGYTMPIPRTEPVSYTQPILKLELPKIEIPKLPSFSQIGETIKQTSPVMNLVQTTQKYIEPVKKKVGDIWEQAKKGIGTTLSKFKFW